MLEQNNPHAILHKQVWELLPWYVNGTLDEKERDVVVQHISGCQLCREEIRRCRAIQVGVPGQQQMAWSPSPEHFGRLMERIDRGNALAGMAQWRNRIREWVEETRLALQETTSTLRWTLAAQCMIIVLLFGGLLWQAAVMHAGPYRTLSDPTVKTQAGTGHIRVVFTEDITERELRELLTGVQGTIVAGPSQVAAYTVAVPLTSGTSGPAEALKLLRDHPKVRLAEPTQS